MLTRIVCALGLCSALAACSSPEADAVDPAGSAGGAPPQVAAAPTPDACTLVSPDMLAEVFAGRVFVEDNSSPVPRNRPGKAGQNSVTSCTYTSAGASVRELMSVTVMVTTAPSDAAHRSVEQMQAGVRSLGLGAIPVDIPDLGDGAYWVNLGSDRRSAVAVNVSLEPRKWIAVSESSVGQDVEKTVQRLIDLARRALTRL